MILLPHNFFATSQTVLQVYFNDFESGFWDKPVSIFIEVIYIKSL